MFEKFSREARTAVVAAQELARDAGATHVDTDHLLVAAVEADTRTAAALTTAGVDLARLHRATARPGLDDDALAAVGIDVGSLRAQADAVFGPGSLDRPAVRPTSGHVPFTHDAKKMLELALREAVAQHDRSIGARHLVLGVLRVPAATGHTALLAAGGDVDSVRAALVAAGSAAA